MQLVGRWLLRLYEIDGIAGPENQTGCQGAREPDRETEPATGSQPGRTTTIEKSESHRPYWHVLYLPYLIFPTLHPHRPSSTDIRFARVGALTKECSSHSRLLFLPLTRMGFPGSNLPPSRTVAVQPVFRDPIFTRSAPQPTLTLTSTTTTTPIQPRGIRWKAMA